MLNKLILAFASKSIENEYIQSQLQAMLNPTRDFILELIIITMVLVIKFGSNQDQLKTVLSIVFLFIILLLRSLISKSRMLHYCLYPLIHLYIGVLDFMISEYIHEIWISGTIAAMLHLTIFSHGINMIWQSMSLIVVMTLEYWLIQIEKNFTFISLIMILSIILLILKTQRNIETERRIAFCEFRESSKWFKILDELLKEGIMLVMLDPMSDQLKVDNCSSVMFNKYKLQTHNDFREMSRQIYIQVPKAKLAQQGALHTLEDTLRDMLVSDTQQKRSSTSSVRSGLFHIYEGFNPIANKHYQIQLTDYFKNGHKMAIVVIKSKQVKQSAVTVLHLAENIFQSLGSRINHQLNYFLNILHRNHIRPPKSLYVDYNYFSLCNIWFNSKDLFNKKSIITFRIEDMIQQLYEITEQKFLYQDRSDQQIMRNSRSAILTICLNLVYFLQRLTQHQVTVTSRSAFIDQQIVIQLEFNCNSSPESGLLALLEKQIYFHGLDNFRKKQLDLDKNRLIISELIQQFREILNCGDVIQISLGLAITKYLLLHVGLNNQILFENKQFVIRFIDLQSHFQKQI